MHINSKYISNNLSAWSERYNKMSSPNFNLKIKTISKFFPQNLNSQTKWKWTLGTFLLRFSQERHFQMRFFKNIIHTQVALLRIKGRILYDFLIAWSSVWFSDSIKFCMIYKTGAHYKLTFSYLNEYSLLFHNRSIKFSCNY